MGWARAGGGTQDSRAREPMRGRPGASGKRESGAAGGRSVGQRGSRPAGARGSLEPGVGAASQGGKMPRVVPDQRSKFENEEFFRKLEPANVR